MGFLSATIAALGFFFKELATVLQQPRLVISLVLGPFLILLLFGMGYRGPHPQFRTILVVPADPAIAEKVNAYDIYEQGLGGVFQLTRIMRDEQAALAELRADRADVVLTVPDDLYERLYRGQRAPLRVRYIETDPTSNAWVKYFTSVQTSELNRRIVLELLRQGRGPALEALDVADEIRAELKLAEDEVQSGQYRTAAERLERILTAVAAVPIGLARFVDTIMAASDPAAEAEGQADTLPLVRQQLQAVQAELEQNVEAREEMLVRLQEARVRVERFHDAAQRIRDVPVEILVSPLTSNAENVAPIEPSPAAFYAPAVLALILQHIGVTLSSLSSVRDRLLGSMELFRVSPVGAGSILVGKSLAYVVMLTVISVALTTALITFLGVPMLGSQLDYWLSVSSVIFAGVGLGFALSTVAATESQAVQYSLLVLLASVFFGGFFLPTNLLYQWVLVISYALPVTYGAIDLREVMLRGNTPELPFLLGPILLGLVFYILALIGLRRHTRRA